MDDKYWIKKERKRQWYLLGAVLCLGLLILGCLPVSVFAAGIQGGGVAARSTHSHDMSVECGNDAPLDYLPLTGDGDGKLYIDGTEVAISTGTSFGGGYVLPEGSYYLAENITITEKLLTEKDKTVNICLNGNTLQVDRGLYVEENGTLCMSDCGAGGRIISDDAVLKASDNGHFIMYGGCLENTHEVDGLMYAVIEMLNSFIKVEIYGGTIKSNGGIGISGDKENVEVVQLSGSPEFVGNRIDVNSDVILHLKDLNTDISEKIKVARLAPLLAGESKQIDSIRSLDNVDYSPVLASEIKNQYFTYKEGQYYVNMAGIMKQPTKEQVCVNAYPVEGAAYQWYEAAEQDVTADRITHMYGMTFFMLQAGDTLYLTLSDMPDSDTVFGMQGMQTAEAIVMSPLGEGRYKAIVENEDAFFVLYVINGGEEGGILDIEDEAYKVVRITQGDAVSGQTINTLTKAAAGTYMCEVTWENLGCCVNSELVELTEAVDAGWTLDADGKLTIASDDGMRNWIENRDACKELVRTAEILEDVTDIKDSAFYGCSSLARVTMLGEMPPELGGSEVFTGCSFVADNTKGIFVPIGKADAYKNAWGDYADYITDGYPEIVTQPTNQSVKNGEQATFSVTAQGVLQPLTYQWQVNKNGTEESGFSNIANATSDTYTITVDKNCNGYWYRCVVTNERGSVTSSALELTVTDSDADKIAAAKAVVEKVLADYTAVNDSTSEDIQNKINTALSSEGITDVTVTVGELAVEKATESEEGSISGSIAIECGSEEDSVTVNKTIAKLPTSDTDKIAAAKAVVEKALAGIVATNETTKEDIQRVVDTALTNAGISDVTVTVGALSKTEATTSAEGSVSGSIAIECGSGEDSVTVNKTIAKLLTSDTDKVAAAKAVVEKALAGIVATNETTKEDIQRVIDTALTNAGISDVTVTVGALSKTEATTSAEGSISGSIAIECGSEKDSVTVNKTIAKLPTSDTDKIAAAKAVVEKALAGIVATNETTKEDIQRVIDTALTNAGISDVTVTVGALSKTEATTSAEGSVSGNVTIECGRETGSVAVNKTIAKLPTSDTDKIAAAKAVVEKALAGIAATNETTKEDIQRVIDTALTNAGISDVTVTVGALSKTEATTSAEGSVSGNVTIECGRETGSVAVNKPIAKLPTSDADKPEVQEPPEKPGSTVPSAVSQKEQEKNALSLNAKLKVSQTDKKINIAWGKVSGADGYDVYVQYCGKKFTDKSITAVKSGKTTKVTVKKVNGKSLNLKKNYKIYVLAYKLVDNKKVTLGKTVTAHIVGRKNTKYTNVKAVKVKKRSYSLKKGETVKIQASTVLVNKSKKQLTDAHAKEFRYATSDKKVATVSKQGKIKAAGKGTCTIYVYARNGYAKQITVKVQ